MSRALKGTMVVMWLLLLLRLLLRRRVVRSRFLFFAFTAALFVGVFFSFLFLRCCFGHQLLESHVVSFFLGIPLGLGFVSKRAGSITRITREMVAKRRKLTR